MWANAQRDGRPAEYRWRPLIVFICHNDENTTTREKIQTESKKNN